MTESLLHFRIERMARDIHESFNGESMTILCVLKGGFKFGQDLMEYIKTINRNAGKSIQLGLDFIRLKSYTVLTIYFKSWLFFFKFCPSLCPSVCVCVCRFVSVRLYFDLSVCLSFVNLLKLTQVTHFYLQSFCDMFFQYVYTNAQKLMSLIFVENPLC